jgi:hypothetical protein
VFEDLGIGGEETVISLQMEGMQLLHQTQKQKSTDSFNVAF